MYVKIRTWVALVRNSLRMRRVDEVSGITGGETNMPIRQENDGLHFPGLVVFRLRAAFFPQSRNHSRAMGGTRFSGSS